MKKWGVGLLAAMCLGLGAGATHAAERSRQAEAVWSYTHIPAVVFSTVSIAIDLSNTAAPWPHRNATAANILAYRIEVDKVAAGTATVKVGVITSVNASSGTVNWFLSKDFSKNVSNTTNLEIASFYPSQLNTYVNSSSVTPFFITQDVVALSDTEALEYQNDVPLPTTQNGTMVSPARGDIIVRVLGGGSTNTTAVTLGLLYFGTP